MPGPLEAYLEDTVCVHVCCNNAIGVMRSLEK